LIEYRLKITPNSTFTVEDSTVLDLLVNKSMDSISEIGYEASLGNVNYQGCSEMDGYLYLKVYGYCDKGEEMVEVLVKSLFNELDCDDVNYERCKEELCRRYGNKNFTASR
jgi:secreted Zn-dependent insulinase-like peptidase